MENKLTIKIINEAGERLKGVVKRTPLIFSPRLSEEYKAKVYLKREDLQEVRSYKIRGAYNLMSLLSGSERKRGVVCASAGNHAQGVAFSAEALKMKAIIFMPVTTPLQKISKVRIFGKKWVEVKLVGQDYDESYTLAKEYSDKNNLIFVHPFDDYTVMAGQGTVGKEIFEDLPEVEYVLCPVGGGGLISGVSTYLKGQSNTKVIGVEPTGAAGMNESLKAGKVVSLENLDTFVDGAAVRTVGEKTFPIVRKNVEKIIKVDEGKVCTTMIELYQNEGIIAEPAGALSVSSLDSVAKLIEDKIVVCILSGGNNDIMRYPQVMEKSLVYRGLKHYFLIEFAQKPGQLKAFVDSALGPTDDIVRFEYIKKNSKETGPALVCIELAKKNNLKILLSKMDKLSIKYTLITSSDILYSYLV